MNKRSLVFLVITAMLVVGCAPGRSSVSFPEPPAGPREEADLAASNIGKTAEGGFAPQVDAAQVDRVVIKNASLTIVVADPITSMDAIVRMAESMGGFVVSSNAYKTQTESGLEVPQASITVRVPVEQLNTALQTIKNLTADPANDVLVENVTGDDVTQQYTDLKSRLRNLERAESQLQEIMASAKDTQDVLATYNQLVSVQEQIEVLKGQIQYYDEAAALSAISVSIVSDESVKPLSIGGWKPEGTARNAVQSLLDTLQFLGKALIWVLLYVLPVVILLYFIVFLPLRLLVRWLRRNRKPRHPVEAAPPEPKA